MNDLVQMLVNKTGLSQEKAQQVAQSVVDHLKNKLPAPLASHLDSFLSGGGIAGEEAAIGEKAKSMVAGLGDMFSKKDQ